MKISHFFIDRPIFASVVSIIFVILGGVTFMRLPVAQYPEIAPPVITVTGQFPGASAVRVSFSESRDEGAPEFPLILAVSYPDEAALQGAMASAVRMESRKVTESVVARFFEGRIHHHFTTASDHVL